MGFYDYDDGLVFFWRFFFHIHIQQQLGPHATSRNWTHQYHITWSLQLSPRDVLLPYIWSRGALRGPQPLAG